LVNFDETITAIVRVTDFEQLEKIGTASVARAFSANLDALTNYSMSAAFEEYFPIGGDFLAPYADFFALSITLVLAGMSMSVNH
jgi:hypothetical protein